MSVPRLAGREGEGAPVPAAGLLVGAWPSGGVSLGREAQGALESKN